MKLFLLGTVLLCMGLLGLEGLEEKNAVISPWWFIVCAVLFYGGSWYFWNRSKDHHRRRRSHEHFTHRNPIAKLPPLREP